MKINPEDNRDMKIVKILNQMKIKILNKNKVIDVNKKNINNININENDTKKMKIKK